MAASGAVDPLTEAIAELDDHGDASPEWMTAHSPTGDLQPVWNACNAPFTLLRLAEHRDCVRAACACARLVVNHVPAGEKRPLFAVEVTEAWLCGEATEEDVRTVARDLSRADDEDYPAIWAAYLTAAGVLDSWDAIHVMHHVALAMVVEATAGGAAVGGGRGARAAALVRALDANPRGEGPLVSAYFAASAFVAAIIRTYVRCPTLDQLRGASRREGTS